MTEALNELKSRIEKLEQQVNEWKIKYKQMEDAYGILDSWADLDHEYIALCDFPMCGCVTGKYWRTEETTCPNTIKCKKKKCDYLTCGCHVLKEDGSSEEDSFFKYFCDSEESSEDSSEDSLEELSEENEYFYCEDCRCRKSWLKSRYNKIV